uniref:NADH-ubiquinone oxidoreductase chain 1 n=1 Tax=Pseudocohnilembus persalinus TaxID=266149 RepID=A0A8F8AHS2_PSEPJ|nr:NADH dehydrogenase subunit 1 [Pseudocohnilembus persalinus]
MCNEYYFYMSVTGFLIILIYNIIAMLLITLVIASLTVIERKVLAIVQRRIGPFYVGYRGRLQYIADALKLFIKGIIVPDEANKFWFVAMPAYAGAVAYTFWMNSVWGPSISIFEIEYNIVYASILSILFGYCIMLTGYFSKSKYAFMSSIRTGVLMLNLEIFIGLMFVNLVFLSESFCFAVFVIFQEMFWFVFFFFGLSALLVITFLLETNRIPFDLAEAESELVTGYTVEYGGFYFALYYLGEYFHLFFFSMTVSIILLGGWELPNFLFYFILSDYNFLSIIN